MDDSQENMLNPPEGRIKPDGILNEDMPHSDTAYPDGESHRTSNERA